MIKIILGKQRSRKGLIVNPDTRIVTSAEQKDIATSLIRLIDSHGSEIKDVNLGSRLSTSDLVTSTDIKVLQEYLTESNLGLVAADIVREVGTPEGATIQVVVVNENATSNLIKPGVAFYYNANDVDELQIIKTLKDEYRLFPDALYGESVFNNALESELELKKLGLARNEVNVISLKNILERLGFSYHIIMG